MLVRKGQTVVQNAALFVFIVVAIVIVSIIASQTTPIIGLLITQGNITGGMGITAKYYNLFIVIILLFVGAFFVASGGRNT